MKHIRILMPLAMIAVLLATGCDKVQDLMNKSQPAKKPSMKIDAPSAAPVPELEILGISVEEQIALRDHLEVRGLMQQANDYVVVINTQLVRKGETMMMNVAHEDYAVEVESINEMRVVLKASRKKRPAP